MASFVFALMQIKKWKRNPRVICAFAVLLLLCLTMTGEYVGYSEEIGLSIQVFEPFILMFTQRYALLFIMLIFLLLYQDVPFIDNCTPYLLIRKNRVAWALGQILYICISTLVILLFALAACTLSGFSVGYFQNIWSDTALFTAYGGALNESAPIELTVIENSDPYTSVACIIVLFFLGTLALNMILFALNLWKGKFVGLCVISGMIFVGYLFSADLLLQEWSGWVSIAYHVNFAQHQLADTGNAPRLADSVIVLLLISVGSFLWVCKLIGNYNFFTGEKE